MTSEGAARVDEPIRVAVYARSFLPFVATCRRTCHVKVTLISTQKYTRHAKYCMKIFA